MTSHSSSAPSYDTRICARGKFLYDGDEKFYVRGVTYGAFRPDETGGEYHDAGVIERDFKMMAANGINTVRIPHTTPPRELLDIAQRHDLRVMVGLSVEQQIGYLVDGKDKGRPLDAEVRERVRRCTGHPALLCYALGNEVPASVVRWLGAGTVERYLERMTRVVREEDPDGLVTYVNYPTTEYLQLPFLDLLSVNVYLESEEPFRNYLARLQNIAGDRPLLMSEVGIDAMRNGEVAQARTLDWQIRSSFAAGCAGVFVFSWTDEWYRGGAEVDDWAFGLTDYERSAKPALGAVSRAFCDDPIPAKPDWPRISVVVCTHNGSRTLRECCEGLLTLEYPDFEVIVVDDGSSDDTAAIAGDFPFRLISTEHRGLSHARNTGLAAATGEIVAYTDDDAYPDPDWLSYLAETFSRTDHVGVGGPNISPPDDGPIAQCISNAPGNPSQVLITDEEAEHIPGCNMAFRKSALDAIGGFDSAFRTAGDDVDVCWRLHERGWTLGFSPAAIVWHHRRASVWTYLRQQRGYGRAETLLAQRWRHRRNALGHWDWHGTIYGAGRARALSFARPRVYHGIWGSAPFQSIYQAAPSSLLALMQLPESYGVLLLLAALSGLGLLWSPLLLALVPLTLAVAVLCARAVVGAQDARFPRQPRSRLERARWLCLTGLLHVVQPAARLWGRLRPDPASRQSGQSGKPGRWRPLAWPGRRAWWLWTEEWREPALHLEALEGELAGADFSRGGDFDEWDLEIRGGSHGSVRGCMAVEDHGSGTQLFRFRTWPNVGMPVVLGVTMSLGVAALAAADGAWLVAGLLSGLAAAMALPALLACARASATIRQALERWGSIPGVPPD